MEGMSNVDVFAITHELGKFLKNARVDKAYQPTKDTILIRFHVPGKGRVDVIFQAGKRVHITQYSLENPKLPPSFPMLLRKYLKGGNILDVQQHDFDRILKLHIQKDHEYWLIIELFAQGNIIVLDEEGKIILPLKRKLWTDRRISSKEDYKYPPRKGINPLQVGKDELAQIFADSSSDVIRTLARSGLGGVYAEEILLRSQVKKDLVASEISDEHLNSIYHAMVELFKPLKAFNFTPQIVSDGTEDLIPLELLIYEGFKNETFTSFNEAADVFYSGKVRADIKKAHADLWEAEVSKFEKRLKIQRDALKKFNNTIETSKKKGDMLYSNYQQIQSIFDTIKDAREKYSWKEISSKLKRAKKEGHEGLDIIESVDKLGNIILKMDNETVNTYYKLSIPENAEIYYEKAKKAKRKIKGVLRAIEKTESEIEKTRNKREIALEKVILPHKRRKKELKWFEKLRWFLSSDGFLVIGGRDATSNELVVKKYMENIDLYFHSDIHGAPSVVVKGGGKDIPETTILEAASFAASFSSAWAKGYASQDVYWVRPDQVSKTPESGEFVAKGAFIIRGTRNYVRGIPLIIAVGVVDYEGERIMAGPPEAVEKYTDNYVVIKSGYTKKEALAREILQKIDEKRTFNLEDVIRVLPSGKGDVFDLHTI